MTDYESKVHNAYFSANFVPIEKLRVFGTVAYNLAEASLDEIVMPHVEDLLMGELEDQDFTFEETHTYSDLDFELLNLQLGMEYKVTPEVTFTAGGTYGDLTDNEAYVFGDETGSMFIIRSGIRVDF